MASLGICVIQLTLPDNGWRSDTVTLLRAALTTICFPQPAIQVSKEASLQRTVNH